MLLEQTLDRWITRPDGFYVDVTLGGGGHTAAALERMGPEGRVLGLDRDPEAVEWSRRRFESEPRVQVVHARYDQLEAVLEERKLPRPDGILADLGVSSRQLDSAERGFAFRLEGPLDLRMDPGRGISAAEWLARAPEGEIARMFFEYGEMHRSRAAARCVVRWREKRPIRSTGDLVQALGPVAYGKRRNTDLAKCFQALRIEVNEELASLDDLLEQVPRVLGPGGRLVVLAYHSLEDRRVKQYFRNPEVWELFTKKAVLGGTDPNPRARSARLRAATRR